MRLNFLVVIERSEPGSRFELHDEKRQKNAWDSRLDIIEMWGVEWEYIGKYCNEFGRCGKGEGMR